MSHIYKTISIIFIVIYGLLQSALTENVSKCRNIPLIENVDIDKLQGVWHAAAISEANPNNKKNCFTEEVVLEKPHSGILTLYDITTPNGNRRETYKLISINGTSSFKVQMESNRNEVDMKTGWLVATDYTSYSLWYLCIPGAEDGGYLYIAVRKRDATKKALKRGNEAFKKLGFKMSNVVVLNQNNCTDT